MDRKKYEDLLDIGIDMDEAMERLAGNYTLLEKMLKRFPEDKTIDTLKEALASDDCEKAFRASHTMKGLCSNLSMKELGILVSKQVELLRAGNLLEGKNMMPMVEECYNKMRDNLMKAYN